jgi:hypothetical protein
MLEQEKEAELAEERERARMLQEQLMKATARGDKAASDEVCARNAARRTHTLACTQVHALWT